MNQLADQVKQYLSYCEFQKMLNVKTLKAYRIDLGQFEKHCIDEEEVFSKSCITSYIQGLHANYKPKTVKRKIACLRAFINYLYFEDQIESNPMNKIHLDFREPLTLPRSLPLSTIKVLLKTAYQKPLCCETENHRNEQLRNIAVLELLFATGLRVSELCSIKNTDIDLKNGSVKVNGKGAKERVVFISNSSTISALRAYHAAYSAVIEMTCPLISRRGNVSNSLKVSRHILPASGCRERNAA